jgi:hypothetical protein
MSFWWFRPVVILTAELSVSIVFSIVPAMQVDEHNAADLPVGCVRRFLLVRPVFRVLKAVKMKCMPAITNYFLWGVEVLQFL